MFLICGNLGFWINFLRKNLLLGIFLGEHLHYYSFYVVVGIV